MSERVRFRAAWISVVVAYFLNSIWYRGVTAPATWLDVLTPFIVIAGWIGATKLDARKENT